MNKVFNWVFSGFFRTIGRVLVYILLALLLSYILKDTDFSNLLLMRVNADAYAYVNGSCSNQYTSYWNNVFYFEGNCTSGTKIQIRFDSPLTGSGDSTVYESISVYNGTLSLFYSLFDSSTIRGFAYNSLCEVDPSASWCSWYPSAKYNSNSLTLYRYYTTSYSLANGSTFDVSGDVRFAYNISTSYGDISNTILTTFESGRQQQDAQATRDVITNDDVTGANSEASSFFTNFTTNNHGLTGIITAPLNAIQSLTSKTCQPLVLPLPYVNQNLTLPCMRTIYVQYFGDFMTLYDIITLGIISYWVMVRIFGLVKDFKNPEHDEIEVVDL